MPTAVKRTSRTKKIEEESSTTPLTVPVVLSSLPVSSELEEFTHLLEKITQTRSGYEKLQKLITETKLLWEKEQKEYTVLLTQRQQQDEIERKREQETYEYDTTRKRKIDEDEFNQKKSAWERELIFKRDELEKEKAELSDLRKKVATFDQEKEKSVKEATANVEKELRQVFAAEKKLWEQEAKSVKELLQLRVETLVNERARQSREIEELKKALDNTTSQIKEIAVKVIESGNSSSHKIPATTPPSD